MDVAGSQQGAVILFDSGSQHGFIYDHDGDGELSDGDTLVDLTTAGGSFSKHLDQRLPFDYGHRRR